MRVKTLLSKLKSTVTPASVFYEAIIKVANPSSQSPHGGKVRIIMITQDLSEKKLTV